ncbi:MAG: indolepyruvate oxidoreductase [Proteobacteria bacterium]|nr:indolepyruvate oxidoreductase [Pseudomonadota bacterium]
MRIQMIISGVGGQGVLFATRIFSEMALAEGHSLIGSETHGMSQRGGSVITHLKIGEFDSPQVKKGSADILFSLEINEAYKTLSFVRPGGDGRDGGLFFVNAPGPNSINKKVKAYLREKGIELHILGADEVARQMGAIRSANIALIGFSCAHPRVPFSADRIRSTIERISPTEFRDVSLKIFEKGLLEGRKSLKSKRS